MLSCHGVQLDELLDRVAFGEGEFDLGEEFAAHLGAWRVVEPVEEPAAGGGLAEALVGLEAGAGEEFFDLADGVEVVRARALRVLAADPDHGLFEEIAAPLGPTMGRTRGLPGLHRPRFATDAVEIRFIAGSFGGGPATAWFRLTRPLVGGEVPTPLQRMARAA